MRDDFYMVVREMQEKCSINFYADIQECGDTGKDILLVANNAEADCLSMICEEMLKNDEDFRKTYSHSALDYMCEGSDNWDYQDSGADCSYCYKWFRTEGEYYSRFFYGDGFRVCENCTREDYSSEYVKSLLDDPNHANTILSDEELQEMGFEKVNDDHYANGMYYEHDDPKKILAKARQNDAKAEYLFSIHKNYNPFEIEFDIWKWKGEKE